MPVSRFARPTGHPGYSQTILVELLTEHWGTDLLPSGTRVRGVQSAESAVPACIPPER